MKTKYIILIICIITLGCMSKHKEQTAGMLYNETSLKKFVTNSHDITEKDAINKVDSILNIVAKDSTAFIQTIAFLEKPFSDPNSAYRNENLYIQLLKAKINSPWYDSTAKTQARDQLYLVMQNHEGRAANDFTYITAAGFKKKMYDLHADFTLLYFYNPECEACKEMKAVLTASPVVSSKVSTGELKILAIYTDKDEKLWLDHLNEMPDTWIQGRDDSEYLYKNKIYDVKAIPTVYLLDKSKNVLLKDCMDVREIEKSLEK